MFLMRDFFTYILQSYFYLHHELIHVPIKLSYKTANIHKTKTKKHQAK